LVPRKAKIILPSNGGTVKAREVVWQFTSGY